MGININVDIDNEGKLKLAVQGHVIPEWIYENSQTEHENQRVRLMLQHQQMLEREAQKERERRRKRERMRQQRQRQQNSQSMNDKFSNRDNYKRFPNQKENDDGPELQLINNQPTTTIYFSCCGFLFLIV